MMRIPSTTNLGRETIAYFYSTDHSSEYSKIDSLCSWPLTRSAFCLDTSCYQLLIKLAVLRRKLSEVII